MVTVSTLYARSESAILRAYLRLAIDLECPLRLYSAITEEEQLTVLQAEIQQKLRSEVHRDWLLVIDGMTTKMARMPYLPQPGSTDWGRGVIVVTTNEDHVVQQNKFATCIAIEELSEEDAINLLRKVTERPEANEEYLRKIVNKSKWVKRYPLDVVSAGLYIKETGWSFESYHKNLPHSHSEASKLEAFAGAKTPISATAKAAMQFAESDPCLKKVFTVFATAPHEPIPMNVFSRLLKSDGSQGSAAIRKCGLISRNPEWDEKPKDSHDTITTLHVHFRTREALRNSKAFLPNDGTVQQFVCHLLEEFEKTSSTAWTRQLLYPHLKGIQDNKAFALDHSVRVKLGVALTNDLNENPHRAREVLNNLESLKKKGPEVLTPHESAKLNYGLGKAHRHLGQYEESIESLTQALELKRHLNPNEVAEILKEFCSTIPSYGEYMESRELLKGALAVFKDDPNKYLSAQAEALSSLAYLCSKMGDWERGKEYLQKAEKALDTSSDPKYALNTAKENLAVANSELGKHRECIKLLKEVRDQIEETYGADHPALAVPLARLSAAHYYNRERDESQKLAETVLKMEQSKSEVYIPWNTLQILGTTACDFGDVARANEQNLIDRITMDYEEEQAEWSVANELLRGRVHRLLGDTNQAQRTLEGALRESESKYGSNNIRVGRVLTELGKVYQEQWYLTQALEAFERSHSIHEEFYGTRGHPEVAFIKGDRATILHRAGDHDNGLSMIRDALGICRNNLDGIHPACMHVEYAQMLSNYGRILRDMRQPRMLEDAKEPLEKAHEIIKRDLSEKSIIRVRNEYALGTVHHGLAKYVSEQQDLDYEKAQDHMEIALNLIDSVGLKHPYRATISTGLARMWLDRKEHSHAQKHANEALAILTEEPRDEIHPHVGYCYQMLGEVAASRDPIFAHDNYVKALLIYQKLIDRETMQTSHYKVNLGNVTVFKRWKMRVERIKEKLHDLFNKN